MTLEQTRIAALMVIFMALQIFCVMIAIWLYDGIRLGWDWNDDDKFDE